ncbi:MAG: phosphoadenosine phosphosulfate reductase family protein [Anaeromicrobium sp.]|uniref:phosphoadenosine phosphosulfate reductase domain-containing protein n=1 Tax=Anaeromicrobium sp. TaxID=1929132 RepID=UPI002ED6A1B3|nr:phosphoadenosine phosphosulfate reductase family protein [Anaeromicrobium sp.]
MFERCFGHVLFPLIFIDTHYKIPEMIEYTDKLLVELKLDMAYGDNKGDFKKNKQSTGI